MRYQKSESYKNKAYNLVVSVFPSSFHLSGIPLLPFLIESPTQLWVWEDFLLPLSNAEVDINKPTRTMEKRV